MKFSNQIKILKFPFSGFDFRKFPKIEFSAKIPFSRSVLRCRYNRKTRTTEWDGEIKKRCKKGNKLCKFLNTKSCTFSSKNSNFRFETVIFRLELLIFLRNFFLRKAYLHVVHGKLK